MGARGSRLNWQTAGNNSILPGVATISSLNKLYYPPDRANNEIRYDAGWDPDGARQLLLLLISQCLILSNRYKAHF